MSYTFRIGNAVPKFDKEDGYLYAAWEVEPATSKDAPNFPNDDMTGQSNERSPSYSAWGDFCKATGLWDLFYDAYGHLNAGHPGCELITEEGLSKVRAARERWEECATKPPGFSGFPTYNQINKSVFTPDEGKYDHQLARLIWLEWWMEWALKNCETPAIQNT